MIPAATPVGSYTIGVRCGGVAAGANQTLMVTAGSQAPQTLNVSVGAARPGDTVTITGVVPTTGATLCPVADVAQLTSTAGLFPPDGFGPQAPRDASGNFHVSYTIPKTTPLGTYTIGVRCGGGTEGISVTLQVAATVATTTTSTTTKSTTTTTKAPATTTTVVTTTTSAPATTLPLGAVTSTTAAPHKASKSSSSLRWVGLAVLALALLIAATVYRGRRGASRPPVMPPGPPE